MDMIYAAQQFFATGAIGCGSSGIIPNVGMFGGYPGGRQLTMRVRYDDLRELLDKREPLVHEIGNPADFKSRVPAKVTRFTHMPPPIEVRQWDVFVTASTASGGLGDPIEREPSLVKSDLDNGLASEEMAKNVYCVAVRFDGNSKAWEIDYAATANLRQAKRRQRLAQGQPMKTWWEKARTRLMEKDLDGKLVEMYQNSMKMSQPFAREFKEFWNLAEEFNFD
jgi:hypothetical protein